MDSVNWCHDVESQLLIKTLFGLVVQLELLSMSSTSMYMTLPRIF